MSRVRIMGILNVTPDSFSDGGRFLDAGAAAERARKMAAEGADLIDMGAESTRPGSSPVPAAEQLRRLLPPLKAFRRHDARTPVSIDTSLAKVAAACLAEGASMINDVSALRRDIKMPELLARSRCGVVLMHMRGTPRTMQRKPAYTDVIASILRFFEQRLKFCEQRGIERRRVMLDPGIGFGKTLEHNVTILRRLSDFKACGRPLLIGVSRKKFLGILSGNAEPAQRDNASIAAGLFAAAQGASMLRVHDVAGHASALRTMAKLTGLAGNLL